MLSWFSLHYLQRTGSVYDRVWCIEFPVIAFSKPYFLLEARPLSVERALLSLDLDEYSVSSAPKVWRKLRPKSIRDHPGWFTRYARIWPLALPPCLLPSTVSFLFCHGRHRGEYARWRPTAGFVRGGYGADFAGRSGHNAKMEIKVLCNRWPYCRN